MEKQRLLETLERLHGELSATDDVDPETLALLEKVTQDIERLAKKSNQAVAAEIGPVSNRLRDLVLKFEAEHPQLSATVGQLADALATLGI